MVVIEMRDNAYDEAFELLEEAKHSVKNTKLTLCELEDAMYDCYEASKDEHEDSEDAQDIEFRGVSGYKEDYRHDEEHGIHDEDRSTKLGRRLMRRHRMGMRSRRRLV